MVRYGIPARTLTDTQVKAFAPGVTSHAQLGRAFGGSDHTDPGKGFPWDYLLALLGDEPSMRIVLLAKDRAGQIWIGDGVQRRPVAVASLPGLLWTLKLPARFGQPAIEAASIETYDDITVLGEPVLTAGGVVDALLAKLPAGTLTRADIEAAVRSALAPGLHLPTTG